MVSISGEPPSRFYNQSLSKIPYKNCRNRGKRGVAQQNSCCDPQKVGSCCWLRLAQGPLGVSISVEHLDIEKKSVVCGWGTQINRQKPCLGVYIIKTYYNSICWVKQWFILQILSSCYLSSAHHSAFRVQKWTRRHFSGK